jgi:transcriptional regulator with XRE-family HTH domain
MAATTRAKKRLGAFLTELRSRTGRALIDPATELKTSESTLSRYESGQVLPVWSTVLALANSYGASAGELARATRLWEDAKDEPKPVRLPASTPKSFRRLVNAEREAESIRTIQLSVIHGLLQTERYTQALFAAGHRFHDLESQVDGAIAVRSARKQRLDEPDPLHLHAILDEAAISRQVGGSAIMLEQLEHLLTMGKRSTITVQVMPFAAGAYGLSAGACAIVDYPEADDTPGVYLEYPAGGAWVENAEDVQRFTTMFSDAVLAALTPADTADLIQQQIRALKNDEHDEVAKE